MAIEELEQPVSQYEFAVLQATENSVPFYEKHGFIRVGAIARYENQEEKEEKIANDEPKAFAGLVADRDCECLCGAGDGVFFGLEYDATAFCFDGLLDFAWWADSFGACGDDLSGRAALCFDSGYVPRATPFDRGAL